MSKRPADHMELAVVADKKSRTQDTDISLAKNPSKDIVLQCKKHSLKTPIVLMIGHDSEIFSAKFHPSGSAIASAGADRSIFFWSARGDCENYNTIKAAHSNTILQLEYSCDGGRLFSCSADKTVIVWDSIKCSRLKKLRNHQSHVNSIAAAPLDQNLLVSVGDDRYVNVWDLRKRRCAMSFQDQYPLTAVSFNRSGDQIFVGGIENAINVWDIKRGKLHYSMHGHNDTITGLKLSPDGHHLLSNSMDNSLKSWDVRPFAPGNRLEKTFIGNQHNFEKNLIRCSWSANGALVAAGSSDRTAYVWNYNSASIVYKLPTHRGSVNEVEFSPREPLILSCGSDKQIFLGEINITSE